MQLPARGSAARLAADALGDGVRLVTAFHSVPRRKNCRGSDPVHSDVLVFGDDVEARDAVVALSPAWICAACMAGRWPTRSRPRP